MEKISISNFRKVKNTWDLDLAPITFFTGTNNSGKSTILKSILLLSDYFNTGNLFELIFDGLNAKKHKIDCYQRAVNNVNWERGKKDVSFSFENNGFDISLLFSPKNLSDDVETQVGKLLSLNINRISDGAFFKLRYSSGNEYQLEVDSRLGDKDNLINKNEILANLHQRLELLNSNINKLDSVIDKSENILTYNSNSKVGALVRDTLPVLLLNNLLLNEDIEDLKSAQFSKNTFGINYPVLKEVVGKETIKTQRQVKGAYRYYANAIKSNSKKYLISSEWFERNKEFYVSWLEHLEDRAIGEPIEWKNSSQSSYDFNSNDRVNFASNKLVSLKNERDGILKKINQLNLKESKPVLFNKLIRTNKRNSSWHQIRLELNNYFVLSKKKNGLVGDEGSVRTNFIEAELKKALNVSAEHLSPNRNSQIRLFLNEDTSTDINEIVNKLHKNPIEQDSFAHAFLTDWMIHFNIGRDYRILQIQGVASVIEILDNNEKWVNIVDKGFGAGQLFCILLKIATVIDSQKKDDPRNNDPQIILIEEPEANLHPALQSKLVSMLVEAHHIANLRFVIETHSEYIIRKTQVLFKKCKDLSGHKFCFDDAAEHYYEYCLTPNTFGVYYFEDNNSPYKMEYREDGKFTTEFGSGFFDESSNLTFEIL